MPSLSMSASAPQLPALYNMLKSDQHKYQQRARKILLSDAEDEETRDAAQGLFGPSRISMSMAALEEPLTAAPFERRDYDDGLGPQSDQVAASDNMSTTVGTGWKDIDVESAAAALHKLVLAGLSHDTPEDEALRERAEHWDEYKKEQAAKVEADKGLTPQQQVQVLQRIMDEKAGIIHKATLLQHHRIRNDKSIDAKVEAELKALTADAATRGEKLNVPALRVHLLRAKREEAVMLSAQDKTIFGKKEIPTMMMELATLYGTTESTADQWVNEELAEFMVRELSTSEYFDADGDDSEGKAHKGMLQLEDLDELVQPHKNLDGLLFFNKGVKTLVGGAIGAGRSAREKWDNLVNVMEDDDASAKILEQVIDDSRNPQERAEEHWTYKNSVTPSVQHTRNLRKFHSRRRRAHMAGQQAAVATLEQRTESARKDLRRGKSGAPKPSAAMLAAYKRGFASSPEHEDAQAHTQLNASPVRLQPEYVQMEEFKMPLPQPPAHLRLRNGDGTLKTGLVRTTIDADEDWSATTDADRQSELALMKKMEQEIKQKIESKLHLKQAIMMIKVLQEFDRYKRGECDAARSLSSTGVAACSWYVGLLDHHLQHNYGSAAEREPERVQQEIEKFINQEITHPVANLHNVDDNVFASRNVVMVHYKPDVVGMIGRVPPRSGKGQGKLAVGIVHLDD